MSQLVRTNSTNNLSLPTAQQKKTWRLSDLRRSGGRGHARKSSDVLREFFSSTMGIDKAKEIVVIDPESLTHQERASRQFHSPKIPQPLPLDGNIFEHFLVVGLTSRKQLKPELLYHYPPTAPSIPGLPAFCFPNEVPVSKLKRTPSQSNLFKLLYNQVHLEHPEDYYIFQLTTAESDYLYGVCILKEERIEDKPSFFPKEKRFKSVDEAEDSDNPDSFFSPENIRNEDYTSKKCYCLLSKFPFFELHFNALENFLALEHFYTISNGRAISRVGGDVKFFKQSKLKKKIKLDLVDIPKIKVQKCGTPAPERSIDSSPVSVTPDSERSNDSVCATPEPEQSDDSSVSDTNSPDVLRRTTQALENRPKNDGERFLFRSHSAGLKAKTKQNKVLKALHLYHNIDIPKPNETMSIKLGKGLPDIEFTRPPRHDESSLLRKWGVPVLLHTLSFENFFKLFSGILLEKRIIFVSSNLHYLSSVILGLNALIKPFIYQGVMIPILPQSLYEFLDAPVPYLLGVNSVANTRNSDGKAVVLDIENNKFIIDFEAELPVLPNINFLRKNFKSLERQIENSFKKTGPTFLKAKNHPGKFAENMKVVDEVGDLIEKFLNGLFVNFRKYCLCDKTDSRKPITVFLRDSFLADQPKQNRPFMEKFVETQMFNQYCDQKLREVDEKPVITTEVTDLTL